MMMVSHIVTVSVMVIIMIIEETGISIIDNPEEDFICDECRESQCEH
jgi:hypothetical protein